MKGHITYSQPAIIQTRAEEIVTPPLPEPSERRTDVVQPMPEQEKEVDEVQEGIPKPLLDLMRENKVTVSEIQKAVASRGYYPEDTPIMNYDASFITGVLVGAWPAVFGMIKEKRLKSGEFVSADNLQEEMPFN